MDRLGSGLPTQLEIGGPRPTSPIREAIEAEQVESVQQQAVVSEQAPVTESRPTDRSEAVKVVAFTDSPVAAVAFGEVQLASPADVTRFFVAHQDSPPAAISISPGAVMISAGGENLKVGFDQLTRALREGDIAGDSQLVQAVIVAENVASLGIPPALARPITRRFVSEVNNGQSPAQARVHAYTQAVAAANLGADPMAQLQADNDKVTAFLRNLPRLASPSEVQTIRTQLTTLIAERSQALMSGNYAAAFDAQEQLKLACERHGIRGIGPQAPAREPAAMSRIAEAAAECPVDLTERRFVGALMKMGPGAVLSFGKEAQMGVKATVGVGVSVEGVPFDVASLKGELGVRVAGKINGIVQRGDDGLFTVTYRAFGGAGVHGGVSAAAGVELINSSGGKDAVGVVQTVAKFATARDAAKFLAVLEGDDEEQVRSVPRRAPEGTQQPAPGRFVVVEETDGVGSRTQSKTTRFGLTTPGEKSTVAGPGVGNFLKRWLVPGISNRTMASETVRFKNTQGAQVAERAYRLEKTGSSGIFSTILKFVSLGAYAGTRSRNRVELKMREVTPPPSVSQARGAQPSTLPTTFRPSLTLQIDSDKVKALSTPESLEVLTNKEFSRTMELIRTANKDSGQTAIDVSDEAQEQLKTTIRRALEKLRDKVQRGQIDDGADLIGRDLGVNVGIVRVAGGRTSGRMVTLRFDFQPAEGGGSRIVADRASLGVARTFESRLSGAVTLGTSEIEGAPVKLGVGVYASQTEDRSGFKPVHNRKRAHTLLDSTRPVVPPQAQANNGPQAVAPERVEPEGPVPSQAPVINGPQAQEPERREREAAVPPQGVDSGPRAVGPEVVPS